MKLYRTQKGHGNAGLQNELYHKHVFMSRNAG